MSVWQMGDVRRHKANQISCASVSFFKHCIFLLLKVPCHAVLNTLTRHRAERNRAITRTYLLTFCNPWPDSSTISTALCMFQTPLAASFCWFPRPQKGPPASASESLALQTSESVRSSHRASQCPSNNLFNRPLNLVPRTMRRITAWVLARPSTSSPPRYSHSHSTMSMSTSILLLCICTPETASGVKVPTYKSIQYTT